MSRRFISAAWVAALVSGLVFARPAPAHLMEDQKGTLNFVGTGAFLVISLPVSAFTGIDDDGDARLSSAELRSHWKAIEDQVKESVKLTDSSGPRPLEGIILDIAPPHERPDEPATHIVALGRFSIADAMGAHTLHIEVRSGAAAERSFEVGVTRAETKRVLVFDEGHLEAAL
jgi:hypothetical protein